MEVSKKIAEITGRSQNAVRMSILRNAKHLLENIPPEEILELFEED